MKKLLVLSNLLLLIAVLTMHFFYFNESRLFNIEYRKAKLKIAVDVPFSLIESFEEQARANKNLDRGKLQEEFVAHISEIRFDQNSVFFIIDGEGNMVFHPLRPELTWWNMRFETDSNGNYLFRELTSKAKRDGHVFLTANWSSKYSPEIFEEQLIYGKYFWAWDWIICTTYYDSEFLSLSYLNKTNLILSLVFLFLVNNLLVVFFKRQKEKDN